MVGNPVNMTIGNKFEQVTDYRSAGPDVLEFTRYYNSLRWGWTKTGFGWRHGYSRWLGFGSGTINVARPDGSVYVFADAGGGTWVPHSLSGTDTTIRLIQTAGGYEVIFEDDSVETYDGAGVLLTIAKKNGYTQTIARNADGTIASVTDSHGRTLTFTYVAGYFARPVIRTVTDPDGRVYTYGYKGINSYAAEPAVLNSVTYPDATAVTYHYEDSRFGYALTGITDETGQRTATWAYDADGRAISSEHAGGTDRVTIAYTGATTRTVTNPLGKQEIHTFAEIASDPAITRIDRVASASTPAATRTFTYDANGFLASETDWNGVQTNYVHNARGLRTSRTEAFGTADARTTTTTWHASLRVPTQIVAPERTTDMTWDADGLMLTRTVTDTTAHVVPYVTAGQTRTATYTYNAAGLVATVDGPLAGAGDTTTYAYDAVTGDLDTVTNALGHVTSITSHDNSGRPLTTEDANGVETTLAYDARGRLLTRTVDSGVGGTPAVTTFAYDAAGQMLSTTMPDGSVMNYEYDAADRMTAIQNGAGERMEYAYDLAGNRTSQTVKDSSLTIVRQASSTFDDLGRMLQSLGAYVGEDTDFAYDANGNTVGVTDPLANVTGSAFDALNRMITVTDALANNASYTYDAAGNRDTATDQRGLVTSYVHDGFGGVIQQSSPDSGATVFEYDTGGRRTRRTDARGVVTDWTYDDLGRTLTMSFPASPAENVTYAYDDATVGWHGIGRTDSVTDDSGSTGYRYDARGNVVRVETVIGAQTYITEYAHDLADRLVSMTYPSGRVVDYVRDAIGRVTDVSTKPTAIDPPVPLASGLTYEAMGGLDAMIYGNGITLSLGHDLNGRMAAMDVFDGGTAILDLDYYFDLAGNITDIDDTGLGVRGRNYAYDTLHRLTQAQELASGGSPVTLQTDYTYDAVGNRTTRNAGGALETLAYDAFSNKLDTVTAGAVVRTLGYSASGNTGSDDDGLGTVLTNLYDSTDRLGEIKQGMTTVAAYLHNAGGQRVAKTVGATTTHYVYGPGGLIAETDGSTGVAQAEYVWLGGMPLAYIQGGTIYYIHADHLGTPQRITDGSAAVVWDADYRPFGAATVTGALTFNLRFPGQYLDAETGMHYNMNRDYDPTTGRYIQSDPIGLGGGWNTYAYVSGNPVMWSDPLGLVAPAIPLIPGLLEGLGGLIGGGWLMSEDGQNAARNLADYVARAIENNKCKCNGRWRNVYEDTDKHGPVGRWRAGEWIGRRPTNGQAALDASVITGLGRMGFDPGTGEIVSLKFSRSDEAICTLFWHGYVLEFKEDFGPSAISNVARRNGWKKPKTKRPAYR